jgi:hypothetical protein
MHVVDHLLLQIFVLPSVDRVDIIPGAVIHDEQSIEEHHVAVIRENTLTNSD